MNDSTTFAWNASTPSNLMNENTTLPVKDDSYSVELIERMNNIQMIVCPILVVFGLLGNTCTVFTVSHRQFYHTTSRYILCALAISDSILLCTNPFNQAFMTSLLNRDIRAVSTFGCKLYFVMYRSGKMSSSWFIVLVAVERFLAVMFPLKAKILLQKRYLVVAITFVYIGVLVTSGIWTFSTEIKDGSCWSDYVTPHNTQLHKSFVILGATSYSLAPVAILLTLTPPIIVKLLRTHFQRKKMLHSAILRSARETSKISIMLIGVVVSYIFWVTPITLLLIVTFWTNQRIFGSKEPQLIILQTVALIFEQINNSSNFLIYVICSSQFRQRFLQMLGCKWLVRNDAVRNSSQFSRICTITSKAIQSDSMAHKTHTVSSGLA